MRSHLLAQEGYYVVSIDSRGSSNRGKAFESHIYKRLGTVELKDQLEVLEKLAKDFSFLDLTRVAINGWSYGGYLALRGIVDHPDVFKVKPPIFPSHTKPVQDTYILSKIRSDRLFFKLHTIDLLVLVG